VVSFGCLAAGLLAQQPTLAEGIDRMFRAAKADAPGACVLVAKGDVVLHQKAYGLADLERRVPLHLGSVFDIGSTSKQFTAACLLLLEQDGKLALGDPVQKHVAELPACCAGVTLRHLMLHTSGIPDYIGLLAGGDTKHDIEDKTTPDDALQALAKVGKLEFATGTQWSYSNSNYFLMSVVVERAGGVPLAELAQQRIFAPLGMSSTHVHVDCTQLVPDRAFSYTRAKKGGWRWSFSNWEQSGDGAVMTTVGDLHTWARNFSTGKVGGDKLLAAMAERGALDDGGKLDYGAGLRFFDLDGTPAVAHGGAWASYRAELLRVPSADLVVVCLCNRDDMQPSDLARRIARLALPAKKS
jgi:CubicO group peptidase (beta-lactamase class C family)